MRRYRPSLSSASRRTGMFVLRHLPVPQEFRTIPGCNRGLSYNRTQRLRDDSHRPLQFSFTKSRLPKGGFLIYSSARFASRLLPQTPLNLKTRALSDDPRSHSRPRRDQRKRRIRRKHGSQRQRGRGRHASPSADSQLRHACGTGIHRTAPRTR